MRSLRAAALYVALTVALTWPLAANLRTVDAGDSAFFAWVIGWEVHALWTSPSRLPHGNIFHPLRYTLGMDEPVLGTTALVLPLSVFTRDAVLLFNVARLLTFALSGLSAYWLARSLRCREPAALLAGALFAFSPIRTDQLAHLSTLGTQWLPLVLLFLHRFARTGALRDALLAGLFFALSSYACGYHGLLALAVMPPAALVLLWGRWRLWPRALAGAAVAMLALLPLYLLHQAALEPLGLVRGSEETMVYSAALETFAATAARNRIWGEATSVFRTTHANNLFPGLVLPVLVLLGAARLSRLRRPPSRDAVALAVLALTAAAVALGPEVRLFGRGLFPGPFAALREVAPVFQSIRVPSRAGVFIALPLALLGAKALELLAGRSRLRTALVGAAALAETVIAPIHMPDWIHAVDTRRPAPAVYEWLRARPEEFAILELPMRVAEIYERAAYHESAYMVRSTVHWKRLANGYAGVEPVVYSRLRHLAHRFPSQPLLDELRRRGVRYVVLHRGGYGPNKWARIQRELPAFAGELREVARFDGDRVFEVAEAR